MHDSRPLLGKRIDSEETFVSVAHVNDNAQDILILVNFLLKSAKKIKNYLLQRFFEDSFNFFSRASSRKTNVPILG